MTHTNTPVVTPAQAAAWLFRQTHFCCVGVHGRVNMMGGLILWTLSLRNLLPGRPPRLYLYGDNTEYLRAAAENMIALFNVPCRFGRLRSYLGQKPRDHSEVLIATPPQSPSLSVVDDRHCFVLLVDTRDPHRWYVDQGVSRAVLPIRLFTGVEPRKPPFAVPNALDILCDNWVAAGKPGLDGGSYFWPTETAHWRGITEGALEASGFLHKPRSIVTVDDI